MSIEKAAMFVDNSNIFLGMKSFSHTLVKKGDLKLGQYLRMQWEKLIELLEHQNGGLDIFARHFFASLPPAADVSRLKRRPTEDEWEKMVKKSAQSGFYKVIQDPPFNFTLHAVPLRFSEMKCKRRMRYAYYRCLGTDGDALKCGQKIDPEICRSCKRLFLHKYEKGVDVALASTLVIFAGSKQGQINRIILVAGDGDFKDSITYSRREIGKDIQIVSWRRPLSRDLEKLANKPTMYLDDHWKQVCEIREKPPLEEMPASEETIISDEED